MVFYGLYMLFNYLYPLLEGWINEKINSSKIETRMLGNTLNMTSNSTAKQYSQKWYDFYVDDEIVFD